MWHNLQPLTGNKLGYVHEIFWGDWGRAAKRAHYEDLADHSRTTAISFTAVSQVNSRQRGASAARQAR